MAASQAKPRRSVAALWHEVKSPIGPARGLVPVRVAIMSVVDGTSPSVLFVFVFCALFLVVCMFVFGVNRCVLFLFCVVVVV